MNARTMLVLALCGVPFATSLCPARGATLYAIIKNMAFVDVPTGARIGDTVEWSNEDFVAHTATARDGSFDVTIPPGKTSRTILGHPGKAPFYCRFHPTMTGQIDVLP